MANNSVVIPCATLGAIVCVMLVFIWLWFPHAYKKGVAQDMKDIDLEETARRAQQQPGSNGAVEAPPPYGPDGEGTDQLPSQRAQPTFEERVAYFKAQYKQHGIAPTTTMVH